MQRLLPIALLVLICTGSALAKDWRGILPLHSTRQDVEKLLGPPAREDRTDLRKNQSTYSLDEGRVHIVFADEEFLRQHDCASLARGTVLMIHVTPKGGMPIGDLQLNEKNFRKFNPANIPSSGYEGFVDEQEGLVVRAFAGKVQEVVYVPTASDRTRCSGYYESIEDFVSVFICGIAFDQCGDILFSDEKARLDNFAIQLLNEENAKGYIIVYASRKATVAEALTRANRARDYLMNVREVAPGRLVALDGGYREEVTVDLYILPPGVEPPLTPTVDPKDVELIYQKPRPKRKAAHRSPQ